MVRMQVSFASVVGSFQRIDDVICRRLFQASFPEDADDVRLPATVDTAPVIPEKTDDANSFVIFSVAPLYRGSSQGFRILVSCATSCSGQLSTAILAARFER